MTLLEEIRDRYETRYKEKREKALGKISKLDVHFIELYIKKMYNEELYDYYLVTPGVTSRWRNNTNTIPESRIHEFTFREGCTDITELFKRIYK